MSLSNEQYETVLREYEEIRRLNREKTEEKEAEIAKKLPGLRALENRIATLSVQKVRLSLDGKEEESLAIGSEIEEVKTLRADMLSSGGFSEEDLEPVYTCRDCEDTGYLVGRIPKVKCHCFRKREMEILFDQSGIRNLLETENFEKLSYENREGEDLKRLEAAVSYSRNFVDNFDSTYDNIVFCGNAGTGKSFLSCCIAHELLESCHSVLYLSSGHMFDLLAAERFGNDSAALEDYKGNLTKDVERCELLIIDDLGTEMTNAFVGSELFAIINERHLHKRPTIISTNLNLNEIRDRYTERTFSRLSGSYKFIRLTGPDIRQY